MFETTNQLCNTHIKLFSSSARRFVDVYLVWPGGGLTQMVNFLMVKPSGFSKNYPMY